MSFLGFQVDRIKLGAVVEALVEEDAVFAGAVYGQATSPTRKAGSDQHAPNNGSSFSGKGGSTSRLDI
jgi:hypothetical protein